MKTPFELIAEHDVAKRYAKDAEGHEHDTKTGRFTATDASVAAHEATKKTPRNEKTERAHSISEKALHNAQNRLGESDIVGAGRWHAEAAGEHGMLANDHQAKSENQKDTKEGRAKHAEISNAHRAAAKAHASALMAHIG